MDWVNSHLINPIVFFFFLNTWVLMSFHILPANSDTHFQASCMNTRNRPQADVEKRAQGVCQKSAFMHFC